MKILRPFCAALALTVSLGVSVCSNAAEAIEGQATIVPASSSLMNEFMTIRSDLTKAEFTGQQMLGRIDSFIGRIDAQIQGTPADRAELTKLRNSALQMRSRVVRFMSNNGTQLVQLSGPIASVPGPGNGAVAEGPLGQQTISPSGMSFGPSVSGGTTQSSGSSSGAGVSGGGGISGGSGLGGGLTSGGNFGLLAAGAAGIATAADDDDNNNPGVIASPSN